ncbi:hypothetical protein V2H45_16650 [Tumidithrix elongata RA019]|uniref:Lipoprotein n=1 Tax=Tumidithrix elongata BACA0141 TaxID=2716417 RepID=A0AAW9PU46_9CYAN|nr:hypothetical protein [Tumidithrix elongata RA019]
MLKPKVTHKLLGIAAISSFATILTACQQTSGNLPSPLPTSVAASSKPQTPSNPTPQASTNSTPSKSDPKTDVKVAPLTLESLAGEYKTSFGDEAMQAVQKQGIKDISGKWSIKPDGSFEATLKLDQQEVKTTGILRLDSKPDSRKVISQLETANGQKPPQNSEPTIFKISEDGKTWQAEGQPIKLLKQ